MINVLVHILLMNDSVFNYSNYKDYLNQLLHSENSRRGIQSQLAKHLSCQSSYIYQVLKSKNDLTDDQAYLTTTFFKLSPLETNHFLLLVRYAKASTKELKSFLLNEIKTNKLESEKLLYHSDSTPAVNSDEGWSYYFSSLLPSYIHMLTSSPKYQSVDSLSLKLKTEQNVILSTLLELKKYGFVDFEKNLWINKNPNIHFSKESIHNYNLHILRRSQAMASIVKMNTHNDLHFSSLFTLDHESYEFIKKQTLENIKKIQKKIHAGGSDELFVMCLDLFSPQI